MPLNHTFNALRRWMRGGLPTWHHPDYRLPLADLADRTGLEPRRADLALWYLRDARAILRDDLRTPHPIPWSDLARVHPEPFLESLTGAEELARIFAVQAHSMPVDEVLQTLRLACGATLAAAREAVASECATLNLLGGFHHAGRSRAGGFCAVNDIAVAVAAMRAEGFTGTIAVLDLDVHPPDGTADCLAGSEGVWLGSISGADWGALPESVDETVLPEGTTDDAYLAALEALLSRMPEAGLTFVIAGGDPWEKDELGPLSVTESGLRLRDLQVADTLSGRASVWLPGGGYGPGSWRPLAGTALAVGLRSSAVIPRVDPMQSRFARLSSQLGDEELGQEPWLTEADLFEDLRVPSQTTAQKLLGFYTAQGVELALHRFGMLGPVTRMGYSHLKIDLDRAENGDRLQLTGMAAEETHMLVECVLERRFLEHAPDVGPVLFIHWLNLRHPITVFTPDRPALPGQDAPGLGMAREVGELLTRMAQRLDLPVVALRPSWYHVAWAARYRYRFIDPARQGRFEALSRDLRDIPLGRLTRAVAEGAVCMDGEVYSWEASEMAHWLIDDPRGADWKAARDAEKDRRRFSLG
ncbi:MAG: acetoin utilization deacetylase AcuC-like enzyme [Myxococcota bacterium]|jgi:acetoin utilization deacetylase AcuC-like enzyme